MDPIKIVEAVAILILGGWAGFKELQGRRDRKREAAFTEEFGLSPNPTRCTEHANAINEIREDIRRIKDHLGIV